MANTRNLTTEHNQKVEIVFGVARRWKRRGAISTGWPDIIDLQVGSNSGEEVAVFRYERNEQYTEQFHIPHGIDFSLDSIDGDMHFLVSQAAAGADETIKMKISMWHLYTGRVLSGLTADATYTMSITVTSSESPLAFRVNYKEDMLDLSSWETNRTIHDGMMVKIERLGSGSGDNFGGYLYLMHGELWLPTDGRASLGM